MNDLIKLRAEKHLFYLCIAATPLWLAWILFDHWFAPDLFYNFLPTRFVGSLMSVLIIFNHFKKWLNIFVIQIGMFATYNAILAYYIATVPEAALPHYFNGYMMVMIVMYMVLIIRLIDIIFFTGLTITAFISVLTLGTHEFMVIMGNGGFSFLTVVLLMILFSVLKWQGVLRDASLTAEIEKARETEELNKTLEQANREKATLLQEIHHRVKNNLQLVSSMLNLQRTHTDDEKTRAILQDSRQRVTSMSRIHETLYRSNNFSSINISSYLKELANEILSLHPDQTGSSIQLDFNLEDLFLNINDAIPIGLIANEVITNSIKHAFGDRKGGKIKIVLKKFENRYELVISDNGVGMDMKLIEKSETLGKELITTLVEQVEAKMNIIIDNGTTYSFNIPLK